MLVVGTIGRNTVKRHLTPQNGSGGSSRTETFLVLICNCGDYILSSTELSTLEEERGACTGFQVLL